MRSDALKWTPAKKKALSRIAKANRCKLKSGASCVYFPLSKTVGIKLYRDKINRDRCYQYQTMCARFALAPLTGSKFTYDCFGVSFNAGVVSCGRVYGYLTERVKLHKGPLSKDNRRILEICLQDLGIEHYDLYSRNVGYLKDGTIVVIDFDRWSCKKIKRRRAS